MFASDKSSSYKWKLSDKDMDNIKVAKPKDVIISPIFMRLKNL